MSWEQYKDYDLLAPAMGLVEHLRAMPELSDVTIHAVRQIDVRSMVSEALAKATGAAVTIGLSGWEPLADGWEGRIVLHHVVTLWTNKILMSSGAMPESILMGIVIAGVQGYCPDRLAPHCPTWETMSGVYQQDSDFRVYSFPANFDTYIPPRNTPL